MFYSISTVCILALAYVGVPSLVQAEDVKRQVGAPLGTCIFETNQCVTVRMVINHNNISFSK
jgi:hypothetical protein